MQKVLDFWILDFGFLDFWIFGFLDFWILDFWNFRFLDFWTFGFLDFWVFVSYPDALLGFVVKGSACRTKGCALGFAVEGPESAARKGLKGPKAPEDPGPGSSRQVKVARHASSMAWGLRHHSGSIRRHGARHA